MYKIYIESSSPPTATLQPVLLRFQCKYHQQHKPTVTHLAFLFCLHTFQTTFCVICKYIYRTVLPDCLFFHWVIFFSSSSILPFFYSLICLFVPLNVRWWYDMRFVRSAYSQKMGRFFVSLILYCLFYLFMYLGSARVPKREREKEREKRKAEREREQDGFARCMSRIAWIIQWKTPIRSCFWINYSHFRNKEHKAEATARTK